MADIPGVLAKMNDIEIAADAPITEALFEKIGANINALIDEEADLEARVTALEASVSNVVRSSTVNVNPAAVSTNYFNLPITLTSDASVFVNLQPNSAGTNARIDIGSGVSATCNLRFNASDIATIGVNATFGNDQRFIQGWSFIHFNVAAGTHTYRVRWSSVDANSRITDMRMLLFAIK